MFRLVLVGLVVLGCVLGLTHVPPLYADGTNADPEQALLMAMYADDVPTALKIVAAHPSYLQRQTFGGVDASVLMRACMYGKPDVVEALLDHGAIVHSWEMQLYTIPVMRVLIAHHADLNSGGLLAQAARNGDYPMVQLLVAHGAQVNPTSPNVYVPLMEAVRYRKNVQGQLLVVSFLLRHGANTMVMAPGNFSLIKVAQGGLSEAVPYIINARRRAAPQLSMSEVRARLIGHWLSSQTNMTLYSDGTISFQSVRGGGTAGSGDFRLIDAHHLRIDVPGAIEVWTLTYSGTTMTDLTYPDGTPDSFTKQPG